VIGAAQTVTQFVAGALGVADYPPPIPKRGERFGSASRCWLCGGGTAGVGWPQDVAIAPTFTQHNTSKMSDSDAVCQSCAALTRAETFQAMVAARKLPIKIWTQAGWHSYSHFVREDGYYEAPVPSRMREILIDPPAGRWVLTINSTGKKHTLFRAGVACGREMFTVQVDEETLWGVHDGFLACLADFERLTMLGCRKDDVLSGVYHPESVRRAGLAQWKAAEDIIRPWRAEAPAMLALTHFVARALKLDEIKELEAAKAAAAASVPTPEAPQPKPAPVKKGSGKSKAKAKPRPEAGQMSLF
jgi:hypothetical protein